MDDTELMAKLRAEGVGVDELEQDQSEDEPLFNWNTAPMHECEAALAVIKADYENALRILSARKLAVVQPKSYKCWSQQHETDIFEADGERVVPVSVLAKCKCTMQPGRWAYADYGAKDEHGNVYTATICSQLCYQVYSRYKSRQRNPSSRLVAIKE